MFALGRNAAESPPEEAEDPDFLFARLELALAIVLFVVVVVLPSLTPPRQDLLNLELLFEVLLFPQKGRVQLVKPMAKLFHEERSEDALETVDKNFYDAVDSNSIYLLFKNNSIEFFLPTFIKVNRKRISLKIN